MTALLTEAVCAGPPEVGSPVVRPTYAEHEKGQLDEQPDLLCELGQLPVEAGQALLGPEDAQGQVPIAFHQLDDLRAAERSARPGIERDGRTT